MARPLWTGSLSFGLVNVPVALHSAVRDTDVHFHQLHEKDGARIEVRRFCSAEDVEVPLEEIGHAYELDSGTEVVLTDADLEAVAPRRTRTIEIESFVGLDELDPIMFDHPYWLVPTGDADGTLRAYALLVTAMRDEERVALGRFVLRSREYLVTIRVREGALALTTMLFPDELRPAADVDGGGRKPSAKVLDGAVALIDALSTDWDPDAYEDRHTARLRAVVRKKRKGTAIEAPEQDPEPEPTSDLLAALRATMRELRGEDHEADDGDDLRALGRDELYARAQDAGVPGRSSMSKAQLVDALRGS